MIEKIVILDEEMKILHSLKINLIENPNIISSLFWIGKTLFYSKGSSIHYFYGEDNINQKVFSSGQANTNIAGILSDRFILVSKPPEKILNDVIVTTPILNPIEPILIGYLDSPSLDYNLVKEAVTNMFSNQLSQNLIEKFLRKDLKEVAWLFISDSKSSFKNIDKKVSIMNDLLKFDLCLDYILKNKNLKNEMDLDDLQWKLAYDHSVDHIKSILIGQCNLLINYGQFDYAIKICELLCDYPKAISLLLISSTKDEYEKLKILFQARGCLSYTDSVLVNNVFNQLRNKQNLNDESNVKNYYKIFDTHKGEPFLFGSNQDKFSTYPIKNLQNKINKKSSHITNIQKRIITYGDTAFTQYVKVINKETSQSDLVTVCSVILQRIDQYFGHKNTVVESSQSNTRKIDYVDYSISLKDMNQIEKGEDEFSIDANADEINENLFLSAYYHCDKGNGYIVEDITENNCEAVIVVENPPNEINMSQADDSNKNEENILWTPVLEEFEPLEYEDKWGRKSPGSHAIKFSSSHRVNLKIKHTNNLNHMSKKFTIEFWLKISNTSGCVYSKDDISLFISNGVFTLKYESTMIPPIKIIDYKLPIDEWNHITLIYKKKLGKFKIYLNCEEVVNFTISIKDGSKGEINFGNFNLDGQLTEIRIWSQEIPIKFVKENHKSPLSILAENKRRLRMKINKLDDNKENKRYEVNKSGFQTFAFGKPNQSTTLKKPVFNAFTNTSTNHPVSSSVHLKNVNPMIIEDDHEDKININPPQVDNFNSLQNFNPSAYVTDPLDMTYPSMNSVLGNTKDEKFNENEFKFEEINNNNINFEMNKDDFNFNN